MEQRVAQLESNVAGVQSTLDEVCHEVTLMKVSIETLIRQNGEIKTDVSSIKEDITGLKSDVASLQIGQARMQEDIAKILEILQKRNS